MWTWHVAEVLAPAVGRFEAQLQRLGAKDIGKQVPGYVFWKGCDEWDALLRRAWGVRFVQIVEEEEMRRMQATARSPCEWQIGEMVSVPCGRVRVVGRIIRMGAGEVIILTTFFGRPIEITTPLCDVACVKLPEVWQ